MKRSTSSLWLVFQKAALWISARLRSRAFWRAVTILAVIDIAILWFLGIAIFLIAFGLQGAVMRLAPLNRSAARLVAGMTGMPEDEGLFLEGSVPLWRKIIVASHALIPAMFIALGLWILAVNGFVRQNLIFSWLMK